MSHLLCGYLAVRLFGYIAVRLTARLSTDEELGPGQADNQ
jgi:hypothetical protein